MEWRGIDYNITLSIAGYNIPNALYAGGYYLRLVGNPEFVLEVVEKEISPTPRFKVKAYYVVRNKWFRDHYLPDTGAFRETDQMFYARGIKFTYTVIA